ncbi:ABC transporter permease [Paenibacillus sp. CAA11]|uniref:ABC transporter permease subunit n=1 Tax=Paenibacillus sp. CAA11 TaxID=1532905 RepID=UPI000D3464DF|nr:ABC transporter permease subunit [Paenibacillus sp. CAA11]AWB43876.1 ABC transporter permease [Paenibacillus sp. CAA11]
MGLRSQWLKSLIIGLIAFLVVILLVLFPRSTAFSWREYANNIRTFFSNLILHQSLGQTQYNDSANIAVLRAVAKSALIIPSALVVGFFVGMLKGMLDYGLSKLRLSFLGSGTTWLFQSVPDFLMLLLALWYIIHHGNKIRFMGDGGWPGYYVPVILTSIYPIVYVARITYAAIATQEGQLYIKTAKAKGLTSLRIFFKHIMANCIGRILTHITPLGVYIISSLVLIEYFRNVLGAARRMMIGIDFVPSMGMSGDGFEPGVIIGIAFFFMLMIFAFQLISYAARRYFDPRSVQKGD